MTRYITPADTAKLVRAAIKTAFPTIKFTVKTKTYSGGASISVGWEDGPLTADVERVAKQFAGATFDGMIDLKSHHDSILDGEKVSYGADFIFCSRSFSAEFLRRRAAKVAQRYGGELVQVEVSKWGNAELIGGHERWSSSTFTYRELVMQEAYKTRVS